MIVALTLVLAVSVSVQSAPGQRVLVAKASQAKGKAKAKPVAEPPPPPAPEPTPPPPAAPARPAVNPDEVLKQWETRRGANPSFQEIEQIVKRMDAAILDFKGVPTQKTVALQAARAQAFVAAMAVVGKRVDEEVFKPFKTEHDRYLAPCASGYWTLNQRNGWAVVDDLKGRGLDAEPLAAEVGNPRCRTRKTARYDTDLMFDMGSAKEYLKRYPRGAHAAQAVETFATTESDRTALAKALMRDEDTSFEDAADAIDGWNEVITATADGEAKTKATDSLRDLRKKVEARAKEINRGER